MGKVSRRGLFGWIGAFAAAGPFVAHARPTRLVNAFADYTPLAPYSGLSVRWPTGYGTLKVGDIVTFNDEPPRIITAVSESNG